VRQRWPGVPLSPSSWGLSLAVAALPSAFSTLVLVSQRQGAFSFWRAQAEINGPCSSTSFTRRFSRCSPRAAVGLLTTAHPRQSRSRRRLAKGTCKRRVQSRPTARLFIQFFTHFARPNLSLSAVVPPSRNTSPWRPSPGCCTTSRQRWHPRCPCQGRKTLASRPCPCLC